MVPLISDLETHAHETKVMTQGALLSGINGGETLEEVERVSDYNKKNKIKERT